MPKFKTVDMNEYKEEESSKSPKSSAKKDKSVLRPKAGPKSKLADSTKDGPSPTTSDELIPKTKKTRSRRYQHQRSQVDKTIFYTPEKAIALIKKISRPHHPTLVADVIYKESRFSTDVSFPHSTGKSIKVAIVDDKLLTQIESGQIDFDVLLSTPEYMPRLAKLARVLGPKGLMPNPKNGTLTPNPAKKQKELSSGTITIKTEKNAPLIHVQFGKIDQPDKELLNNLQALVKTLNLHKIAKLTISSTMSPGVKLDLNSYLE